MIDVVIYDLFLIGHLKLSVYEEDSCVVVEGNVVCECVSQELL